MSQLKDECNHCSTCGHHVATHEYYGEDKDGKCLQHNRDDKWSKVYCSCTKFIRELNDPYYR